jgi:hypothetical protein
MNIFRFLPRNRGGVFMSKEQQAIQEIEARLAEKHIKRAAILQRQRDNAVAWALADDEFAAAGLSAELAVVDQQIEQLTLALKVANEDEVRRRSKAADAEYQAQQRARTQHDAALIREAAAIAKMIVELQAGIDSFVGTAGKRAALLEPDQRGVAAGIEDRLLPAHLSRLVAVELFRVSHGSPVPFDRPAMPDGSINHRTGAITPLVEVIENIVAIVKRHTEAGSGQLRTLGGVAHVASPTADAAPLIAGPGQKAPGGRVYAGEFAPPAALAPEIENVAVEPSAAVAEDA